MHIRLFSLLCGEKKATIKDWGGRAREGGGGGEGGEGGEKGGGEGIDCHFWSWTFLMSKKKKKKCCVNATC